MNKNEIKEIFKYLKVAYTNYEFKKEFFDYWEKELINYDFNDIMNRLKELMSDERYSYQPPLLDNVIKGLTRKNEKVIVEEKTMLCPRCNKPLSADEYEEHFDRCSSIDYVIRESKKWFRKELTRKFLWQMSKEEFDERYYKLLKYIMEHTNDENERKRISYIFNPPSQEEAQEFLKQNA